MKLFVLTLLILGLTLSQSSPLAKKVEKRTALESSKAEILPKIWNLKNETSKSENFRSLFTKLDVPKLNNNTKGSNKDELRPEDHTDHEELDREKKSCNWKKGKQPGSCKVCLELAPSDSEVEICDDYFPSEANETVPVFAPAPPPPTYIQMPAPPPPVYVQMPAPPPPVCIPAPAPPPPVYVQAPAPPPPPPVYVQAPAPPPPPPVCIPAPAPPPPVYVQAPAPPPPPPVFVSAPAPPPPVCMPAPTPPPPVCLPAPEAEPSPAPAPLQPAQFQIVSYQPQDLCAPNSTPYLFNPFSSISSQRYQRSSNEGQEQMSQKARSVAEGPSMKTSWSSSMPTQGARNPRRPENPVAGRQQNVHAAQKTQSDQIISHIDHLKMQNNHPSH